MNQMSKAVLFGLAATATIAAQSPAVPTRAELYRAESAAKAANPPAATPDRLEIAIKRFKQSGLVQQIITGTSGFGVRFGGLPTGGGFALGPSYSLPALWNENAVFKVSAAGSIGRYYGIDASLSFPRLANRRIRADFFAAHNDSPSIGYFGPGPDSSKNGRTNFRREDTVFSSLLGVRIHPHHFTVGMTSGLHLINVGPGTSRLSPSADRVYTPRQAPGLQEQTDFFHLGPFLQIDYRDRRDDPHRGAHFVTRYVYMNDQLDRYSFRRLESVLEGYIPFLNEKRVIALRARTDLSFVDSKNQVPFYMQPVLGGSDDLRGFRQFRFYDNNALLLNAEYRWEVAPALDMVAFADAGRVFHRPGDIGLSGLEGSGGLGMRFKNRDAVVMRIDAGFSREGVRVWFKFGPTFTGLFHNLF
ncbi:MAG: BamA/TamA family outer membrane protein [Bryobacterales bacterium]|nr:BamA/TamA family outer membrane protein [Bryobacterales bacterium]